MRAIDFYSIIKQKICLIRFLLIDVGRCLKTLIATVLINNCDNLVIFKFRNSKFALKDNFVNN